MKNREEKNNRITGSVINKMRAWTKVLEREMELALEQKCGKVWIDVNVR